MSDIKQKAREIITKSDWFLRIDDRECDFNSQDDCLSTINQIIDLTIATTLKEIEEGVNGKKQTGMREPYMEGYNEALDDIKQLIHQKLIK